MPSFLAQVSPQQSTQYSQLASTLAPHELRLSSLGGEIDVGQETLLGGQTYVPFELGRGVEDDDLYELGRLAMTSAFFRSYDSIGDVQGPLLAPLETGWAPAVPRSIAATRRYRGKTNELFTHFLCNVARASSGLSRRPWDALRVFDPLAGGGTTLFTGLVLGASVAGVEHRTHDTQSTAAFLRNYCREQGISCKERTERLKGVGRRWQYSIGREIRQICLLGLGETTDSASLIAGFRPHLIVTDLPYGIQHQGELISLLTGALPEWASLLPVGGALAMSWESQRFERAEMIALVESTSALVVLNDPPYDALAHRVDRVIKRRDVIVARHAEGLRREKGTDG